MTNPQDENVREAYQSTLRSLGKLTEERDRYAHENSALKAAKESFLQLRKFHEIIDPLIELISIGNAAGSLADQVLHSPILHRGCRLADLCALPTQARARRRIIETQEGMRTAVGNYIAIGGQRWQRAAQNIKDLEARLADSESHIAPDFVRNISRSRKILAESVERDFAIAAQDLLKLRESVSDILSKLDSILNSRRWKLGLYSSKFRRRPASEVHPAHQSTKFLDELRRLESRFDLVLRKVDRLPLPPQPNSAEAPFNATAPSVPPRPPPIRIPPRAPRISYERTERPEFSLIILNRNGAQHLSNLLNSFLAHNTISSVEFIVVDHASTDESVSLLKEFNKTLPLTVIEAQQNYSFSYSNNRAAERAKGDKLLFLNNDIIFSADVLPHFHQALEADSEALCGARLYYPGAFNASTGEVAQGPLQHAGIFFREDIPYQFFRPHNAQQFDLDRDNKSPASYFPASTAAALACRREVFFGVGGFCEEYQYGYEDVDFCLSYLNRYGRPVNILKIEGLLHNEGSTQALDSDQVVTQRRITNIATLRRRFGRMIRRAVQSDLIESKKFWTPRVLRVGFAVTECGPDATAGDYFTALELGAALKTEFGWEIEFLPRVGGTKSWYDVGDVDVLVSMLDNYDVSAVYNDRPTLIKIAWMRNWFTRWAENPWFHSFDLFLCSSEKAVRFIRNKSNKEAKLLRIATNTERFSPGPAAPQFECDYCFVGGYFGANRDIEAALKPSKLSASFKLYGTGWADHLDFEPYFYGPLAYEEVPSLYRSAKIVLDDANHVTKSWASVNSRVFDALAAGCLVITNGGEGAEEVFGDLLPVYGSPEELCSLLEKYLGDERLRETIAARCREIVLDKHTYRTRAFEFKEILLGYAKNKQRFSVKVPAPSHEKKHEWGDYHFAVAIRDELQALGHSVRIDILPEWDTARAMGDDVVLVLRGLSRYSVKPGALHLMWNISHPETVSAAEYNEYDHVFVASLSYAQTLRSTISSPISPLLQCTSPRTFFPDIDDRVPAHDLLFVGNSRKQPRQIVIDSVAANLPLSIYGSMWEDLIPHRYLKGTHIPNTQLRKFYSRAKVVLNDHWPSMREHGFISNRIFDAGACGASIISDSIKGIDELFGDLVVTYSNRESLREKAFELLENDELRKKRGEAIRKLILEKHTFAERTKQILQTTERFLRGNTAHEERLQSEVPTPQESPTAAVG